MVTFIRRKHPKAKRRSADRVILPNGGQPPMPEPARFEKEYWLKSRFKFWPWSNPPNPPFGLCGTPIFFLVLLSASLHPWPLLAQPKVSISDRVACPQCRIDTTTVVTLADDPRSEVYFSERGIVRLLPSDHYSVVTSAVPHRVYTFSPTGKYVGGFGTEGMGPGEVGYVQNIAVLDSGSQAIVDMANSRLSVFDDTGRFQNSGVLPFLPSELVELPNGNLVAAGDYASREAIGHPLHLMTAAGHVMASFGSIEPFYRPDQPHLLRRSIAVTSTGTILSVPPNRYVIEEWDPNSRSLLRAIDREGALVPGWHEAPPHAMVRPPPETIGGIWLEESGVIGVLIHVAAADWTGHPEYRDQIGQMLPATEESLDRYYDSVVEFINIEDATVMARQRYSLFLRTSNRPGILVHVASENGLVVYRVLKVTSSGEFQPFPTEGETQ